MQKFVTLIVLITMFVLIFPSAGAQTSCTGFMPSRLTIGELARVTLGAANNVRAEPHNEAEVVFQLSGGSLFIPLEGPVCDADGLWWRIRSDNSEGWTLEGQGNTYWTEPFAPLTMMPNIHIQLAFTTAQTQSIALRQVYIWDSAVNTVNQITFSASGNYDPRWSPDGNRIAYIWFRGGKQEFSTIDLSGANRLTLFTDGVRGFSWSPDGQWIALSTSQAVNPLLFDLLVIKSDGSATRQLTNMERDTAVNNGDVSWSPDGSRIIFSDGPGRRDGLFYVPSEANMTKDIVPFIESKIRGFEWSPDGHNMLVEVSPTGDFSPYDLVHLDMYNASGVELYGFFAPEEGNIVDFDWAPDSSGVLVSVWRSSGVSTLYFITRDASMIYEIPIPHQDMIYFDWRPVASTLPPPVYHIMGDNEVCSGAQPPQFSIGQSARVTPGLPNNFRLEPDESSMLVAQIGNETRLTVLNGPICTDEGLWWLMEWEEDLNNSLSETGTGWTLDGNASEYWLEPDTP